MLAMMVVTSPLPAQRSRIVLTTIAAAIVVAVLLTVLLSFDSISEMFNQRASFDQSYDEGRFGRFGRHILGAQMALDLPFGIGPLQFHNYFPEDTHNSYLNAFMSGGWLSGVCYPALVFITVIIGFPASSSSACPGSAPIWRSSRPSSALSAKTSSSTPITGGISG